MDARKNHPMHRPEVAAKVSRSLKGKRRWDLCGENSPSKRPEVREKNSKSHRNKKLSEEHKNKISQTLKGKIVSEKWKNKISQAIKNLGKKHPMKRIEVKEKMIKNLFLALKSKPNKCELQLQSMLDNLQPNEWEFVGDGKVIIEGFCPDFINVNGKKLIIEFNGTYWHRNSQKRDQRKIEAYASKGFKTLIVWEDELKNINLLKERLTNFNIKEA